jgi:prepilin-type N-terminal cleavage/methylation domain-containing protein/prepilin-type processing-associated H-X9-DG protein
MNTQRIRRTQSAFTLIELLVVIAIIAILAAILFPVFAQAREKARATSCLSNSKQQALAFFMYAQDYDETTVPVYWGFWGTPWCGYPNCPEDLGHNNWPKLLFPYIKNKQLFTCPSLASANWDTLRCAYDPQGLCRELFDFPSVIGYALNPLVAARSLAAAQAPANTVAITESRYYPPGHPSHVAGWGWYGGQPPYGNPPDYPWSVWLTGRRHQDGLNVSFADGHSKYQRHDFITNCRQFWMWRGDEQPPLVFPVIQGGQTCP